ncbi:hypothetical protein BDZ94DRAFT_1304560 [Collybia nuda]|uniref:Uncharacterized protein n=1 Tax=Collybia nuda TaxID=64659 RepID=A0A9P6CJB3_9AGAR|nr:hypothetical protein BDZ94DRAFT_1304560 [Collybia nuda]
MVVYMLGITRVPMTTLDNVMQNGGANLSVILLVLVLLTIISMLVAELMLILRVSAVYHGNKPILALLIFLWVAHLATMSFFAYEASLFLSVGNISKILFIEPSSGVWFVIPAVVFDAAVGILLTVGLYRRSGQYRNQMPLVRLIIRDGTLYFFVVFVSNLTWVLVRFICKTGHNSVIRESDFTSLEIWSACITTTMIGRLTLNLKRYNLADDDEATFGMSTRMVFRSRPPTTFDGAYHYNVGGNSTETR